MKVGTVGAGYIGQAVSKLLVESGNEVIISNSRGADTLKELATKIGCKAGSAAEAVAFGDVVVLTIPFVKLFALDPKPYEGKIVIDTNNYYPDRDGKIKELDDREISTSGIVQRLLPGAKVVKAFNSSIFWDLATDKTVLPNGHKRALPIAGDYPEAKAVVTKLIEGFGFDVLDTGSLADSWRSERGKPCYLRLLDVEELKKEVAAAKRDDDIDNYKNYNGTKPTGL